MYPAAEGRSPAILNWLRHIGIWVQFTAPKVLTWSHLPCTGYSRRLMSTLSSLTLETFYRIRRPLSSTSQGSISTFMSILLGRALNSYLKLSSSVHCVARSDPASNPRWISVKKKNISKIYVSMHLDSESSYKKKHVFDTGIAKAGQEKSVREIRKHGNSNNFWESFQERALPLLLLVSFPPLQTPLVSSPWRPRPPSISGRPPSVWGTKLIQGYCGRGTCNEEPGNYAYHSPLGLGIRMP